MNNPFLTEGNLFFKCGDAIKSYKEKMKSSYSCKMCKKEYDSEEKMKKCKHNEEKSMDEAVIPNYRDM